MENELSTRKQLRLKNYDYSQNGCYFVTICTDGRQPLFWNDARSTSAEDDRGARPQKEYAQAPMKGLSVELSQIGRIADKCWNDINKIYQNVRTDYYVIMPDHFHGIIIIDDDLTGGDVAGGQGCMPVWDGGNVAGGQGRPPLQKIIQGFKSVTTRMCFEYGYRKIWQRSYYEHIIRNETDYIQTVEYILNNPLKRELTKREEP